MDRPPRCQFLVEHHCGETLMIVGVSQRLPPVLDRLSRAEREVVDLVLEGCSNAEVAERRRTSAHTVANQLKAVFRKLGCSGRSELVAILATPFGTGGK